MQLNQESYFKMFKTDYNAIQLMRLIGEELEKGSWISELEVCLDETEGRAEEVMRGVRERF